MTRRTAIAPRPRAPLGDSRVVPFPRRGRHVAHAGGGRGAGPGARPPSDNIDVVIRLMWEVSWAAAGELYDALNGVRGEMR
jgi:hypothetical protein